MGDLQQPVILFGRLHQHDAICQPMCHGLFQQHVIALLHGFNGGYGMLLILGADDGHVGHLRMAESFFPAGVLVFGRNGVPFGDQLTSGFDRFGDSGDLQLIGMVERPCAVDLISAVARPDQQGSVNFFGHLSVIISATFKSEL